MFFLIQFILILEKLKSIAHRAKLDKLHEHISTNSEQIKEVNGVRFCCSTEFLVKGGDHNGTCVYLGLGKDGCEKAVKCFPRDACTTSSKQTKKIFHEIREKKSNYLVNYWFLDDESDKDYLYLILDLCEENLEDFIRRTNLDELVEMAPKIIRQILKGLDDLHRNPQAILHRDIKPHNILRGVNGNWFLTDFGLSRLLTGDACTHQRMQRRTDDWRAVESCLSNEIRDDGNVPYKKASDVQVGPCRSQHG